MGQTNYDFSIIFVDDGSTDQTLSSIQSLAEIDKRVKYIELSRNFGHQFAIKAGLDHADAEIVIMMDCDLQHPPELIPMMLMEHERGYEIVRTHRKEADHESYLKKKTSSLFYSFISKFSEVRLEKGSADFRLVSGKALEQLRNFNEMDLFFRGLIKWMGFKQVSIEFEPNERQRGETKYTFAKMFHFGLKGFTSFSTKPLYFSAYFGILVSIISLSFLPYVLTALFTGHTVAGWASIMLTISFFGGLNLLVLGIIGIYLAKLFVQSKSRPHYIIRNANL
jgi:dolichol-phosphate mannosyltransferase